MEYTHFDQNGNAVMVDVSDKIETKRTAVARGSIRMSRECYEKIKNQDMKKEMFWELPVLPELWGQRKHPN